MFGIQIFAAINSDKALKLIILKSNQFNSTRKSYVAQMEMVNIMYDQPIYDWKKQN